MTCVSVHHLTDLQSVELDKCISTSFDRFAASRLDQCISTSFDRFAVSRVDRCISTSFDRFAEVSRLDQYTGEDLLTSGS